MHADFVDSLWEEGLRTLYLPMPLSLSAHEIDALRTFAERGGTIVSEAFPGLYDEGGHLETSALALRTIFGLEHVEVQNNPHDGAAMLYPLDGTPAFAGRLYRQIVRPLDGTQVLAKYADGLAAATSCSLGAAGQLVHLLL